MSTGVLQAVTLACCAIACVSWWRSRQPIRHEAPILLGIFAYFFIGTLNVAIVDAAISPRFNVNPRVWILVAAGSIAYLVAAWLGRLKPPPPLSTDQEELRSRGLRRSRVLAVVGWIGLVLVTIASRAPLLTGSDREEASGYLTTIALLIIPAILLRVAALGKSLSRRDWIMVTLAGIVLLLTNYRTYALLLGLSVICLHYLRAESLRQRVRIGGAAVVLTLLLGIVFGYWRFVRGGGGSGEDASDSGEQLAELVLGSEQPDLLGVATAFTFFGVFREGPSLLGFIMDQHPTFRPYTGGAALLGSLTAPLPGEQMDARGILSKELYGTEQTSLVSSIFGPLYLDFGMAGVVTGMALLGFLLSRLERRALERQDPFSQAGFAYGFVVVALSIHSGLTDFAYLVLIPAALLWASRRPALAPAPPAEAQTSQH